MPDIERDAPLPAGFPDVGPNDPVVKFSIMECRTCNERGDAWRRSPDDEDPLYEWNYAHWQGTGHRRFYRWTIERGQVRLGTLPEGT